MFVFLAESENSTRVLHVMWLFVYEVACAHGQTKASARLAVQLDAARVVKRGDACDEEV